MNLHGHYSTFNDCVCSLKSKIIVEIKKREGSSSDDHRAFDCPAQLCE